MTEFPTILLERVTLVLAGVCNSTKDPHCSSRAAMAAADFYLTTREAAIRREEQAALREELDLSITIATRERSARYELQQQAVAACLKIARKHYRAKRPAASGQRCRAEVHRGGAGIAARGGRLIPEEALAVPAQGVA